MLRLLVGAALLASAPAQAQDTLLELINAYRAAPGSCEGQPAEPAPPLAPQPALARVQVGTGTFLEPALEGAGYPVTHAEAIVISGPSDAGAVMSVLKRDYCRTLLSGAVSAAGASRSGDTWQIVFAQPAPPSPAVRLPALGDVGKLILDAVNAARATARSCGEQRFAPAPPLSWNEALAKAALVHSRDMATQRYFAHKGKDGSVAADRATKAGYRWRRIGENIAAGQESPDDAVAGWLASPGHCANLMDGGFTEMGAAYAINTSRTSARVYWTQVFGTPR